MTIKRTEHERHVLIQGRWVFRTVVRWNVYDRTGKFRKTFRLRKDAKRYIERKSTP